uniref:Cathepsin H n=1 Tax=Dicentrarchus labrax TaxID=13489 RepID=A0A8C4F9S4_DICLA
MNTLFLFALLSAASAFHVIEQGKLRALTFTFIFCKIKFLHFCLFVLIVEISKFLLYELFSDEFHFKSWMVQHNKMYDMKEYYERLQIFSDNKRRVDKHNEGNHSFTMRLNQFSDMTFGEFRKTFLWSEPQNCSATRGNFLSSNGPHPDSIDWRKKGNYVTPVKNQGGCGSCWTFSTTGCLESVIAIKTGKLVPLSEQQLVDCAQNFNNHGFFLLQYNEMEMVDAVGTRNPVSFAFEVTSDFMHYSKGVYTSTECHKTTDKVNHAVLAVGYGNENGSPYWIVKNSWGPTWGIDGYFLIERGSNMCGLAACSSFPEV